MKKTKYYFIDKKGEMILARTSKNEYKYALIYKDTEAWRCSSKKEACEVDFKYYTKGYGYNYNEKVNGKYLYSSQFYNPNDFKIVELIKG